MKPGSIQGSMEIGTYDALSFSSMTARIPASLRQFGYNNKYRRARIEVIRPNRSGTDGNGKLTGVLASVPV